uniref:Patched domain-containing protein 3-like n=1 Tax=Saccoglossus kowalevskii TaxID=10224 RepID=A0ABM0LZ25_SACKO|nr:PREDICTED: patched domain-containing protein 3-like [Saccoglossus kowalevskii]
MAFYFFERRLKVALCSYGRVVGNYPIPFIVLPLMLTFSLAVGGFYFTGNNDIEYLFTPTNGPAKKDRDVMDSLFPMNYSGEFLANRQNDFGRYASVIIYTKKQSENILAVDSLREIFEFHDNVTETKASIGREEYSYRQLCAKWKKQCVDPNPVLKIYNYTTQNVNFINISYPVMAGNISYFIGGSLGGVQFYGDTSIVKSARAILLFYPLKQSPNNIDEATLEFENKVTKMAAKYKSTKITVTLTVSQTLANELDDIIIRMIPRLIISFFILTSFSVLSLMMTDWVTSKPVLGTLGVASALLAVISTIGLLSYCGVPFIHLNIAMPFLTLGVGVDDMFIMIASWRTTSPRTSVPDRMAETFSEAALSITITSITDVLAFGIGAISTFPSVQIFCCYCGVAILFDYIYQITFFGGCMALIGRRERQNKHCLTYVKVLPKKESSSRCYRLFCAGGISNSTDCDDVIQEHSVMTFFNKYYGPFVTLTSYFLTNPLYEHYKSDVAISNNTITSSRFSVQSRYVKSAQNFLHQSRKIVKDSSLPMIAYHPSFVFNDHVDVILPNTIQNIAIAAAAMLVVSFLLIPQPICALYVTLTVASIVVGVIGYMSLWSVGIDFVSMVTIVVCIGFSVDYSAHLTYAFVISPRDTRNGRAVYGLYLLGLPIVQSVVSTIIAIAPLSTANTYVFRAVFKTVFLGIFFGGLHGILFLPVLLSLVGPNKSQSSKPKADEEGALGKRRLRMWMKDHRMKPSKKRCQRKITPRTVNNMNDNVCCSLTDECGSSSPIIPPKIRVNEDVPDVAAKIQETVENNAPVADSSGSLRNNTGNGCDQHTNSNT